MGKLNRSGFTLVELLAVIAILSVIMLIGGQSVFGAFDNASKEAYKIEVGYAIQAAQAAYRFDMMNQKYSATDKVCYSIEWLKENEYYKKEGNDAGSYLGSVLIDPTADPAYEIWMQNNKFIINNGNLNNLSTDGTPGADGVITAIGATNATVNCNNAAGQHLRN